MPAGEYFPQCERFCLAFTQLYGVVDIWDLAPASRDTWGFRQFAIFYILWLNLPRLDLYARRSSDLFFTNHLKAGYCICHTYFLCALHLCSQAQPVEVRAWYRSFVMKYASLHGLGQYIYSHMEPLSLLRYMVCSCFLDVLYVFGANIWRSWAWWPLCGLKGPA